MSNNTKVKCISLMLDEQLLSEAMHALGVKTYSAAVNLALAEAVPVKKIQSLREAFVKTSGREAFPRCGRIARTGEPSPERDPRGSDLNRHFRVDIAAQQALGQETH